MIRKLINLVISKLKKEKFEIDSNIPLSYILNFALTKLISLCYGMLSFRSLNPIYRSCNTTIKCKHKITFGRNSLIAKECYIDGLSRNGISIGDNVSVGYHTTILATGSLKTLGKGIKIGNNVGLGTHGFYGGAGGLEIGDDTIFGNYVSIHPENHNYSNPTLPIRLQGVNHRGVKIGKNCWIGAKVTILDGTCIGDGCIVAAGAVVKGTFQDNVIIGGIPARIIKSRFDKI